MSRNYFIRELGIELLASACSLSVLRHDHLDTPLEIAPHHHDGMLQLDLIRGCQGRVLSSGRWLRFDGDIALAAYPGETHGYTLDPITPDAVVYNLKIRPQNPLETLRTTPVPRFAQSPADAMFDTAGLLAESVSPDDFLGPQPILSLLSLLIAWPDRGPAAIRNGPGVQVHPVVERAVTAIESNLHEPLGLDDIAREVNISSRQLSRLFEQAMGITPHRYSTTRRLDRAKTVLLANRMSVGEVADLLGFSGHATFTRWFSQHVGMTPSEFRSNPKVF